MTVDGRCSRLLPVLLPPCVFHLMPKNGGDSGHSTPFLWSQTPCYCDRQTGHFQDHVVVLSSLTPCVTLWYTCIALGAGGLCVHDHLLFSDRQIPYLLLSLTACLACCPCALTAERGPDPGPHHAHRGTHRRPLPRPHTGQFNINTWHVQHSSADKSSCLLLTP